MSRDPIVMLDHGITDATPVELRRALEQLPPWRKTKAESFRFLAEKMQCAQAYLLLCRALKEHLGISAQPHFGYGPHGKPYLEEYPQIHFNLSHCKRGVLCVLSTVAPVGCDIEEIPTHVEPEVMQLCLSPQEIEQVKSAAHPGTEFAQLWTRKEALVKLSGTGLTDIDLKQLLQSSLADTTSLTTTINETLGYAMTIATPL